MQIQQHRVEMELGGRTLALETGSLAGQANGEVTIAYGDTVCLVTATSDRAREGLDFFPLLVDFEERFYAAGKIPGSRFVRREGKASEEATLTARLIDHAIRPLFPKGARNDVQVVVTTLSAEPDIYPDMVGLIGASAALMVSDIVFNGPIAAVKVGLIDGEFVLNPGFSRMHGCELELVVSGTRDSVQMVEVEAHEVSEEKLVEAIEFGQQALGAICELQEKLVALDGKPKMEMTIHLVSAETQQAVDEVATADLEQALRITDRHAREPVLNEIRAKTIEALTERLSATDLADVSEALEVRTKKILRRLILDEGYRPDGRAVDQVRPLSARVGLLPRTHGSALFQRGETQALSIATLGSVGEEKLLDGLGEEESKRFLHHYNFPPYSTGETKPMRGPGRREIGHGALAEKSIRPVLPADEDFPYMLRVVSEILSSNGSTSMASVCGGCLCLMDAGVPLKAPVAGISVGLVTDDKSDRYVLLTDIQGLEDFSGDMDFKAAGSRKGITGVQLDLKLPGVSTTLLREALERARVARNQVLDVMATAITEPRSELSPYAPRVLRMSIPVDKIGTVIGPGGKTIRGIIEETGCKIDIEDDGSVFISTQDSEMGALATKRISDMTREVEVGEVYTGRVTRLMPFGAFVEILPGREGLVHISQMAWEHVRSVEDAVNPGDVVQVRVSEIDEQGRTNLSMRDLLPKPEGYVEREPESRGPRPRRPDDRGDRRPPRRRDGGGGGGGRPPRPRRD